MLFTVTALLGFSSTPGSIEGCFNYYTGSCQGCGEPDACSQAGHHGSGGMPTFYTGEGDYCAHCPDKQGCWDGAFCGALRPSGIDTMCAKEHCTCVTEDKCVANSPAYVPCEACGADGDPDLKELPQPDGPDAMKGCFNAFSGQCTGCGRPRSCPDYNNADLTDPMGFPYFYTGTSAFCSHCPDSQGCWDGDFAGGPEHCTCVTDPTECVPDTPRFSECKAWGADEDPPMQSLPLGPDSNSCLIGAARRPILPDACLLCPKPRRLDPPSVSRRLLPHGGVPRRRQHPPVRVRPSGVQRVRPFVEVRGVRVVLRRPR